MELSIRGMFRPSLAQLRCYRGFTLYLWRCRQVATILKLAQASFILSIGLVIANYSKLYITNLEHMLIGGWYRRRSLHPSSARAP